MGNSSTPSSPCCLQVRNVVQQSPQRLCSVLDGGPSLGITINQTLALFLPGACQCKAASGPTASATSPAGSPAISPSDSSNETPDPEITPSASVVTSGNVGNEGDVSKTVPTAGGKSDGSITRLSSHFSASISIKF